ncbi:hypothetical protein Tco_1578452 [Tanacetum coccineum]
MGKVTLTAISSLMPIQVTITEASLRRHLKLEDLNGITSIPNLEIFEQLALMGYQTDSDKVTFQKGVFSLMEVTSSLSLSSEPSIEPTFEPQPSPDAEYHVPSPNESPLYTVHLYRSDEGSLKLNLLTNLVTEISKRIGVLEDDLKRIKKTYNDEVVHDQDTVAERQLEDSTAGITVSTAPINISTARETHSTAGRVVYDGRSKEARKDKGKAIMTEPEPEKKSKKLLEQERLGLEEAIILHEQLDERKELK